MENESGGQESVSLGLICGSNGSRGGRSERKETSLKAIEDPGDVEAI